MGRGARKLGSKANALILHSTASWRATASATWAAEDAPQGATFSCPHLVCKVGPSASLGLLNPFGDSAGRPDISLACGWRTMGVGDAAPRPPAKSHSSRGETFVHLSLKFSPFSSIPGRQQNSGILLMPSEKVKITVKSGVQVRLWD